MTAPAEAPAAEALAVTEPGVYQMSAEDYHRDVVPGGSLSSSGARKLLPPSCPAKFKWDRDNVTPPKTEFEIGTAAHRLILGDGPNLVRTKATRWDSKAAKQEVADIREAGGVPLKPDDYQRVHTMADALRRHPVASALFNPEHGRPEQSLFCQDPATGVWLRTRLDWLPNPHQGRLIIPEYKTCRDASDDAFAKSIATYGYHQQADFYTTCTRLLHLAGPDSEFLFVAQEKEPPYLVNIVGLEANAWRIGRAKNRAAIERYAECAATDTWPGYGDDPNYLPLPPWAEIRDTDEYEEYM